MTVRTRRLVLFSACLVMALALSGCEAVGFYRQAIAGQYQILANQKPIGALIASGADTLVTGELKQAAFNTAQEEGLNLYLCGHYATEVFGVQALAAECARRYRLPWEFLDTGCPL